MIQKRFLLATFVCFAALALTFADKNPARFSAEGLHVDSPEGLCVYKEPDFSSEQICTLLHGEYVVIEETGSDVSLGGLTAPWIKILLNGYRPDVKKCGWVFGGALDTECPLTQEEAFDAAQKNGWLAARFFPTDGANYFDAEAGWWQKESDCFESVLRAVECDNLTQKPNAITLRDCLVLEEEQMSTHSPGLIVLPAGKKLTVRSICGYGIKDKILYPIYNVEFSKTFYDQEHGTSYEIGGNFGKVRGTDITGINSISFASDGKGGQLGIIYQSAIEYDGLYKYNQFTDSIEKIESAFKKMQNWNSGRDGWIPQEKIIAATYMDSFGKCRELTPCFTEPYKRISLRYPLNMKTPVPFAEMSYDVKGLYSETAYVPIIVNESGCEFGSPNFDLDESYDSYKSVKWHYFAKDGLRVYWYLTDSDGTVTCDETECFLQDEEDPACFYLEESYTVPGEPKGKSQSLKKGQFANPIKKIKLYSEPNLQAKEINTVMYATLLQVVQVGKKAKIDGLSANWVKVRAVNKETFADGSDFNCEGWVFGGYLD